MHNFKLIVLTVAFYLGLATSPVLATPILNIDINGQLTGASDIDISGSLFDVEFMDGTCITLFDGCDELSDFFWATQADARNASLALGTQIFNSLNTVFENSPELIYGCTDIFECQIRSPYALDIGQPQLVYADFYSIRQSSNLASLWLFDRNTEALFSKTTYAMWSAVSANPAPPPNPVPEPQTLGLLLLGLAGLTIKRVIGLA